MIEVDDIEAARHEIDQWRGRIDVISPVISETIEPYWKIPAYQDVTIYLQASDTPEAFEALINLVPEGWVINGDDTFRCAVWNPTDRFMLLSPLVKWAELSWEKEREVVSISEELPNAHGIESLWV